MTTPDTPVDTVNTLHGLRCADPQHRWHGTVYCVGYSRHRLTSLAVGTCYQLVQSGDNAKTWQAVDPQ